MSVMFHLKWCLIQCFLVCDTSTAAVVMSVYSCVKRGGILREHSRSKQRPNLCSFILCVLLLTSEQLGFLSWSCAVIQRTTLFLVIWFLDFFFLMHAGCHCWTFSFFPFNISYQQIALKHDMEPILSKILEEFSKLAKAPAHASQCLPKIVTWSETLRLKRSCWVPLCPAGLSPHTAFLQPGARASFESNLSGSWSCIVSTSSAIIYSLERGQTNPPILVRALDVSLSSTFSVLQQAWHHMNTAT